MKEALGALKTFLDFLESSTTIKDILFDYFPASFEEVHIETIRAKSFLILHLIDNFTNLLFRQWPVKIVVVFPG